MWNKIFRKKDRNPDSLPIVKTVSGQVEAMILKARLEAENIPVHLSYESTGPVYGFSTTHLGKVQIMVPAPFENAARIICGTDAEGSARPGNPEDSPEDSGNHAA